MSHIRALGYVGFTATNLSAWKTFASDVLGLQVSETLADGTLVLRADAYQRRVFLHPGDKDDLLYTGWETDGPESLQALRHSLSSQRIDFTEASRETAASRSVLEMIQFKDTDGNTVEASYGPTIVNHAPFRSPLGNLNFVTGDQGLGHVVYATKDYAGQIAFYRDKLGFKLSDTNDLVIPGAPSAFHLTFLHVNPRHHSLAFGNFPLPRRFNHLMLEVSSLDEVGFAFDRARASGAHILMDLGRHTNDHVVSFYVMTPSGWSVEIGWGSLRIDDESWHVTHHPEPSSWGHKFSMPPHAKPHD